MASVHFDFLFVRFKFMPSSISTLAYFEFFQVLIFPMKYVIAWIDYFVESKVVDFSTKLSW